MRSTCLTLLALAAACQPDLPSIKPVDTDVPDPVDTDVGIPPLAPDIEVTPTAIRFPGLPLECPAEPETITVTNVGTAALTLDTMELKGAGSPAYTLDLPRNPVLQPGESRTLEVGFTPRQYATYDEVKVVITSDDPDEAVSRVDLWGQGSQSSFREELWIQEQTTNVDVLFAIDNSGSMDDDINNLKNTFDAFIASFTNLGLDYRIAATAAESCATIPEWIDSSNPDPVGAFRAQADAVKAGSFGGTFCGGEAGFAGIKGGLTSRPDFLRPDAGFAAIAVSDEPEQSNMTAQQFANWLLSLKADPDDVSFSAFTGPKQSAGFFPDDACPRGSQGTAEAAPQYHAAIQLTHGVWGDFCTFDIAPFLRHVSYVAAGLEYRFELSSPPTSTSPSAITVLVDGVEVPWGIANGWTYDADNNAVEFHGTSIPDPGAEIVVRYPYDSGC